MQIVPVERNNTMSKKLFTGYTARQELILWVRNKASISDWSVADALEYQFYDRKNAKPSSLTSEMWNYWSNLSSVGQSRLFSTMKSLVIADDRRRGLKFNR
jgi:hypothetical protein